MSKISNLTNCGSKLKLGSMATAFVNTYNIEEVTYILHDWLGLPFCFPPNSHVFHLETCKVCKVLINTTYQLPGI